jgi:hypothetical protein
LRRRRRRSGGRRRWLLNIAPLWRPLSIARIAPLFRRLTDTRLLLWLCFLLRQGRGGRSRTLLHVARRAEGRRGTRLLYFTTLWWGQLLLSRTLLLSRWKLLWLRRRWR